MQNITAKAQAIVRAAPLDVYRAFVDADKMSKFWLTRRDDGLQAGEPCFWFVGQENDAYVIDVIVKELKPSELILLYWGDSKNMTQVHWQLSETDVGHTKLIIEESGYKGSDEEILANVLDSTGGFNQVIIALKAYLEHDAIINVVDDHISKV